MGVSISWIGARGLGAAEHLGRFGLRDTGLRAEWHETRFAIAELPTGWTILFANDLAFGAAAHLAAVSAGAALISCQAEEHVMFSAAHFCNDGRRIWSVSHNGGDRGALDLRVQGTTPAEFESIRTHLLAQQRAEEQRVQAEGGPRRAWLPVDYVFDAPIELAAQLTGYRHDRWQFNWGEPAFRKAERA